VVIGAWGGVTLWNESGVGLRIDVPSYQFYWRGPGYQAFFAGQDGQINAGHPAYRWAAVYAVSGTIQTSDADTKEDIRDSELGLDFVEKLKAKEFKYKDDPKEGRIGFMTQDVEEVLEGKPFAALDKPENGPSGLNYAGFVPILTKAIQELSARVRELEK